MQVKKVTSTEFIQIRNPRILMEGFQGIFIVASSAKDRIERAQETYKVRKAAKNADLRVEWCKKYQGWIVQYLYVGRHI